MRSPLPRTSLSCSSLLSLLLGSAAGWAQTLPPPCTPGRAGQHACMAQEDCECRFERGGTLLGQPAGWRWSCSLLAGCEAPTPAAPAPRGLPDGFSYAPGAASGTAGDAQASQPQGRGLSKTPLPYAGDRTGAGMRPYGAPYR